MISLIPLTIAAALVSLCPAAASPAAGVATVTVTVTANASLCTAAAVATPNVGVLAQPAVDTYSASFANATAALKQLVTATYALSGTVAMIQNGLIDNLIPAQLISNEQQYASDAATALTGLAASNVSADAASSLVSDIQTLTTEVGQLPGNSSPFTSQFLPDFATLESALHLLANGVFSNQTLFVNATAGLAGQIAALQ